MDEVDKFIQERYSSRNETDGTYSSAGNLPLGWRQNTNIQSQQALPKKGYNHLMNRFGLSKSVAAIGGKNVKSSKTFMAIKQTNNELNDLTVTHEKINSESHSQEGDTEPSRGQKQYLNQDSQLAESQVRQSTEQQKVSQNQMVIAENDFVANVENVTARKGSDYNTNFSQKVSALSMYKKQNQQREQVSTQSSRESQRYGLTKQRNATQISSQISHAQMNSGQWTAIQAELPKNLLQSQNKYRNSMQSGIFSPMHPTHSLPSYAFGYEKYEKTSEFGNYINEISAKDINIGKEVNLATSNRKRPMMDHFPSQRLRNKTGSSVMLSGINFQNPLPTSPRRRQVPKSAYGKRQQATARNNYLFSQDPGGNLLVRKSPDGSIDGTTPGQTGGEKQSRHLSSQEEKLPQARNTHQGGKSVKHHSSRGFGATLFGQTNSFRSSFISQRRQKLQNYEQIFTNQPSYNHQTSRFQQNQSTGTSRGSFKNILVHKRNIEAEMRLAEQKKYLELKQQQIHINIAVDEMIDEPSPLHGPSGVSQTPDVAAKSCKQFSSKLSQLAPFNPIAISKKAKEDIELRHHLMEQIGESAFCVKQKKYDKVVQANKDKEKILRELQIELKRLKFQNKNQNHIDEMSSMAAQSEHRSQMTSVGHESVIVAPQDESIEMTIQDKLQKKIGNLFSNFATPISGSGILSKEQSPQAFADQTAQKMNEAVQLQRLFGSGTANSPSRMGSTMSKNRTVLPLPEPTPHALDIEMNKLVARKAKICEELDEVSENTKVELVETESIKLMAKQEQHEVLALKIQIEEIQPQESIYSGASHKFERLQMMDQSRKAVHASMLCQKKKMADEKLKNWEDLLASRVAILTSQQKKSVQYKKQMHQCDAKKEAAKKNLEELKVEVLQKQGKMLEMFELMDLKTREMRFIRQLQIIMGVQNTMKQIKQVKPEDEKKKVIKQLTRSQTVAQVVASKNQQLLTQLQGFSSEIHQEFVKLDRLIYDKPASGQQPAQRADQEVYIQPEQRMQEFKIQIDSVQPVWQEMQQQMEVARSESGRDELVDFEFIDSRLKEMQFTQQSLASLQFGIQNEINDKQVILQNFHIVFEQFKKDGLEIDIDISKNEGCTLCTNHRNGQHGERKITTSSSLVETLNHKKFSTLTKKIENLQFDTGKNESFCFSTLSCLSFMIVNAELFMEEAFKLFNNFKDIKGEKIPILNLMAEFRTSDFVSRAKSGRKLHQLKKTSGGTSARTRSSKKARPGAKDRSPSGRLSTPTSAISPSVRSRVVDLDTTEQRFSECPIEISAFTLRFKMVEKLHKELTSILSNISLTSVCGNKPYTSLTILKESLHIDQISRQANLIEYDNIVWNLKQNPMFQNVKRVANLTYRSVYQGEIEHMEKQNEFKIKVMERRRRQGAGRAEVDRRQTPLRIDEDYYDPITRAIDTEKLQRVEFNTKQMPMSRLSRQHYEKKNKKGLEQLKNRQQLTQKQIEIKELNKFRDEVQMLHQFERDEFKYSHQLQRNNYNMQERLNMIKVSNFTQSEENIEKAPKLKIVARNFANVVSKSQPKIMGTFKNSRNNKNPDAMMKNSDLDMLGIGIEMPVMTDSQGAKRLRSHAHRFHGSTRNMKQTRDVDKLVYNLSKKNTPKLNKTTANTGIISGVSLMPEDHDVHHYNKKSKSKGTRLQKSKRLGAHMEVIPLPQKKKASQVVSLLQKRFPAMTRDMFREEIEQERRELENSDSISEPPAKQDQNEDGNSNYLLDDPTLS